MQITGQKDLADRFIDLYKKGQDAARQSNHSYAIDMFTTVLKKYPGFLEARTELRKVELDMIGNKVSIFRQKKAQISGISKINKARKSLKDEQYGEAMAHVEEVLAQDPTVPNALALLADIAHDVGLRQLAVDTLEILAKFHPKNIDAKVELAEAYSLNRQSDRAVALCKAILKIKPTLALVENKMTDYIAKSAMDQGGWTADKEKTANNQASSPAIQTTTEDAPEKTSKLQRLLDMLEAGNDTLDVRKNLARQYAQEKDFEKTLEHLAVAKEKGGENDPLIFKLSNEANLGIIENAIIAWQEHAKLGEFEATEAKKEIAQLHEQKSDYLLTVARKKAQRFHNDANARMELAVALFERDLFEEALTEFFEASRSPRHRDKAAVLKAICQSKTGKTTEAKTSLEEILPSLSEGSENHLEALYELSQILKEQGNTEEHDKKVAEILNLKPDFDKLTTLK